MLQIDYAWLHAAVCLNTTSENMLNLPLHVSVHQFWNLVIGYLKGANEMKRPCFHQAIPLCLLNLVIGYLKDANEMNRPCFHQAIPLCLLNLVIGYLKDANEMN